ncbi:global transcription factor group E4 [Striga asiatica]|uniref:Global transcription factor group E4 n=1 Tax=Striga asiatica TaxID=4170 RepID=A0A5A7QKQ2_STRAF|nr:global transcription factor group E4 [Striga asiatica]
MSGEGHRRKRGSQKLWMNFNQLKKDGRSCRTMMSETIVFSSKTTQIVSEGKLLHREVWKLKLGEEYRCVDCEYNKILLLIILYHAPISTPRVRSNLTRPPSAEATRQIPAEATNPRGGEFLDRKGRSYPAFNPILSNNDLGRLTNQRTENGNKSFLTTVDIPITDVESSRRIIAHSLPEWPLREVRDAAEDWVDIAGQDRARAATRQIEAINVSPPEGIILSLDNLNGDGFRDFIIGNDTDDSRVDAADRNIEENLYKL